MAIKFISLGWWRAGGLNLTAIAISGVALVVSIYAAYQSHRQANETQRQADIALESFNKNNEAAEKAAKEAELLDWQFYIVHSIVDNHSSSTKHGISFDEIKNEYLKKVMQYTGNITKEAIQDHQLKKVLVRLKMQGLVFKTYDEKYVAKMSEVEYGVGRTYVWEKAAEGILFYLATNGPCSNEELLQIAYDKYKLTPQEYYYTLAALASTKLIFVNNQRKLACAISVKKEQLPTATR